MGTANMRSMNYRASGWRHRGHRPDIHLIALTMFSLSLGVLGPVGPAAAQTTNYPGADYQMWRDDEIFVPLPTSGQLHSASYEYDPVGATLSGPLPYCEPTVMSPVSGLQMAAAAGRIMSPYSDQVVFAYVNAAGEIEVHFADGCNLADSKVSTGPPASLGTASGMPALAAPPAAGFPWWYEIASGDLDKQADVDSNYRDEVVVAYLTQGANPDLLELVVAVLDYSANASAPTVTWMKVADYIDKEYFLVTGFAGKSVPIIPLSVVTGDFDGDTRKEIALAYVVTRTKLGVVVFRYTTTETDGAVTHTLNQVAPLAAELDKGDYYQGTIDAAAGDFDGDGKDELAVAAVGYNVGGGLLHPPWIAVDLKTFKADADLAMTQVSTAVPYEDSSNGDEFVSGVQLAAGLFKYAPDAVDPTQNFDITRRQLALATNGSSGAVDLRVLVYDALLTPALATTDAYQRIPASGSPPGKLNFRMAAGGFNGLQTTESPAAVVSSLAFMTWADDGQVLYLFDPDPSTGKLGTPHFSKTLSNLVITAKSTSVVPLVAYDYGKLPTGVQTPGVLYGDSQYLGAPLYFRIEDVIMTDYILQEPPKHVYWKVGNDPYLPNCADRTVCNISGQDAFTLGTIDTQSLGMTSEYHDTFDRSWGVSETGTFELTYGAFALFPPKASASLSETFAYEFTDHTDDYNKSMSTRTLSVEHMATRDDAIKYRVTGIDVWRYPVFGVDLLDPDGNPMPYAYFDVTAPQPPSPEVQTYLLGGIDASDWYQPLHENGNIISYPAPVGGANRSYLPADMGSFQVPCTDLTGDTCDKDEAGHELSTLTITDPLLDEPTMFVWSGTSQTVTLIDSRSETKDHTHTWSKTLKNSEELKMTGRIPLGVKPGGFKINLNLDVAFNGKWSWGGAHTMEMKSDEVSTLKLSVPAGVSSEAYNVYPSFYVSTDGTMKVGFAVDADTFDGNTFWEAEYYAQPDPALNLPLRFNASTVNNSTVWTPNTVDNRKLMRGFFVRHAEADEAGDYPEYDGPPTVGDQVRLEARVHNYSLGQNVPVGMKVRFDYVPIDYDTHVVQEDKRTEIATTTIEQLDPRGMTTATVDWDTSQLDLGGKLEQSYRIYVVLDPDNEVSDEKYETESPTSRTYPILDCADPANLAPYCIDPGQNNEGWREVQVLVSLAGDPRFGQPADVHLKKDALAARDPRRPSVFLTNTVQAEEGQRLELRVRIDSDMFGAHYGHLLIFDGDPRKGGTLIAHKRAFTGNPDGSYVWAEWTAAEPGPHRLYAKLLESSVDTQTGNAIDDLMVVVHKAKDKGKGMSWASESPSKGRSPAPRTKDSASSAIRSRATSR